MMSKLIFVSNDDGIESPGLRAAVEAALPLGDVLVAAPTRQGTSMGRSLRGRPDERFQKIDFEVDGRQVRAYHLDCSPAMAVKHGLDVLCPDRLPDLVISGINYGENLGVHITHSGTVGAALQGTAKGIPAVAASLQTGFEHHFNYGDLDWRAAIHHVRYFAASLLSQKMPFDVEILKVDVPADATPDTPWRITRLARQPYYISTVDKPSPESKIGDARLQIEIDYDLLENDSDIQALAVDGVVSVTPLSLDLTARIDLQSLAKNIRSQK